MIRFYNKCCEDCWYAEEITTSEGENEAILYVHYVCEHPDESSEPLGAKVAKLKRSEGERSTYCERFEEREEVIRQRIENKSW